MTATVPADVFGATDDFGNPLPKPAESACVYFGVNKLQEVKQKAERLGLSFSTFVNQAVDEAIGLDKSAAAKLRRLARKAGTNPAEFLAALVERAAS
jgi:hypothetical protein